MSPNYSLKLFKCEFCEYETKRNYNLKRHCNVKHVIINTSGEKKHNNCEKVQPEFICKKCNKIYKSNRYLINHEKNCNGLDDLTCPRCMISFTTKQGKSNHLKKKNCKPRSIKYARNPNNLSLIHI